MSEAIQRQFLILASGGISFLNDFVSDVRLSAREHIFGTTGLKFTKFFVQVNKFIVAVFRSSYSSDALFASSFIDDVILSHDNGSDGDMQILLQRRRCSVVCRLTTLLRDAGCVMSQMTVGAESKRLVCGRECRGRSLRCTIALLLPHRRR